MNKNPSTPHVDWRSATLWGFFGVHTAAVAMPALGITITLEHWLVAAVLFVVRSFFVAIGYHRYFSHKSFRFARRFKWLGELILAIGTTSTAQTGPIWWARSHRDHHRFSDKPEDHHSPINFPYARSRRRWVNLLKGFWWSHVGWVISTQKPIYSVAGDLESNKTLVWLDKHHLVVPVGVGALCTLAWGWSGLAAFFISTVVLWHSTFTVNSVAHLVGSQRYDTGDQSRNCWPLSFVVVGEQWHNNHHHNQGAARQGQRWYEIDLAYYVIWTLYKLRIIEWVNNGQSLAS